MFRFLFSFFERWHHMGPSRTQYLSLLVTVTWNGWRGGQYNRPQAKLLPTEYKCPQHINYKSQATHWTNTTEILFQQAWSGATGSFWVPQVGLRWAGTMFQEILAFILTTSGWVLVSSTLPTDYWKVSSIDGTVITTATFWSNLWKTCVTDSTGVSNCKDFPSMLALDGLYL